MICQYCKKVYNDKTDYEGKVDGSHGTCDKCAKTIDRIYDERFEVDVQIKELKNMFMFCDYDAMVKLNRKIKKLHQRKKELDKELHDFLNQGK